MTNGAGGTCDAVVIGAGHNGLVAAALLADAGWDVVVLEGSDVAGGAVRSTHGPTPGFVHDMFSAFYPMTAASPVMTDLHLEDHGLSWVHAPKVLTNVRPDAPGAVLYRDGARTAADLELHTPGDGDAWLELHRQWEQYGDELVRALLSPFPPVRAASALAWAAREALWDLVRMMALPVRTMVDELFTGPMAPLLLAGNALHADVTPESAPSALLGWLLVGLAQTVGFPVPLGGAGMLAAAVASRAVSAGAQLRLGESAESVELRHGRASAVHTAAGTWHARHAVLAACDAEILYGRLLAEDDLPAAFTARMREFHRAGSTVKVDYALSSPVPWSDDRAVGAGTVHVADGVDELTTTAAEIAADLIPSRPFLLMGQMTTADPTRSPVGTESLWVYTHVPQDIRGDAAGRITTSGQLRGPALAQFVERMEDRIESHAPGFRDRVVHRSVQGPADMERTNPSLIGGDISGGTAQLHQQLVFRPVPGLARAETPVPGLYLASSSAHPGGSVHGACGANAARAALAHRRASTWSRNALGAAAVGLPLGAAAAFARSRR